jgi:hypothetical protein
MTPARTFFIAALCGAAVSALPFDLGSSGFGTNGAYAKSENGGGNGGGHGGNGGGNGGKGGASEKGGSQGKSASAAGQNKASVGKIDRKAAKIAAKQQRSVAKQQQVAAVAKEKNLNAKLGRLNSLKRNINAYINSKSPNFAAVQAFVMGAAEAGVTLAAEQDKLQALNDELTALQGIAAPTQAQLDRIGVLPGLITEQQGLVAAAEQGVAAAEDPAALAGALNEMSNKQPVDDDVVSWAEGVLGVGPAVGKIDEMREVLDAAAEEAAAETAETTDPVVPVEPAP